MKSHGYEVILFAAGVDPILLSSKQIVISRSLCAEFSANRPQFLRIHRAEPLVCMSLGV
jgi:hypothetical protein